jgi:hypothetical protein
MVRPIPLLFLSLLSLALIVGSAARVSAGEPTLAAPQEGFLVLANGSVLEGTVAQDGDYFQVLLEKGKLQVRVDQVDFFCHSMEEAYVRRRARRIGTTSTVEAHLEMARWCVQHDLLANAAAELQTARTRDAKHPQIELVERQVIQAHERVRELASAANVIVDHRVQPASAEIESDSTPFGEIPLWARSEFIKRIQPMMAHSCATAGCHMPNSSQSMRIYRNALDGVGNPELIHGNLAAVIGQVDLENPEESPLLMYGAAAHGTARQQSRPLTPHQLEILRAWVTQVSLGEPPAEVQPKGEARVAQIVIGMNSTSQPAPKPAEQERAAAPDPFDPAAFNQEQPGEAAQESEAPNSAQSTPAEESTP